MSLYECDRPGCDWRNPDWRYGFADAGATYHLHLAEHERSATVAVAACIPRAWLELLIGGGDGE